MATGVVVFLQSLDLLTDQTKVGSYARIDSVYKTAYMHYITRSEQNAHS